MTWSKADFLLFSKGHLITLTTAEGTIFGFTFALYVLCARSLYLQLEDRDRRRLHLFTLLSMSLVVALALVNLAVDAQNVQTSYIDHADYPGGGTAYSFNVFRGSSVSIVGNIAYVLIGFITSCIQIWRLWMVWRASRYLIFVIVLPALTLLANLGLQIANIAMNARSEWPPRLSELFFYGETAFALSTPVLVTIPIIARIIMVRRKHIRLMGQTDGSSQYTSIISMLVESFALESVWMIIQLSFDFSTSAPVASTVNTFFVDTQSFIQLLAYLLVVHRVATGLGWKEDTAEELTTLQWNRDGLQTTQMGTRASIPISHEDA